MKADALVGSSVERKASDLVEKMAGPMVAWMADPMVAKWGASMVGPLVAMTEDHSVVSRAVSTVVM